MSGLVTLKPAAFPPFDSDDPALIVNEPCDTEAAMLASGFSFPEAETANTVAGRGIKFDQRFDLVLGASDAADFSLAGTVSFEISRHCLENKASEGGNVWVTDRAFTQTGGITLCRVTDSASTSFTSLYNNTADSTLWYFRHEAQATQVQNLNNISMEAYRSEADPEYARVTLTWAGGTGVVFVDGREWGRLSYTDALITTRDRMQFGLAGFTPHDGGALDSDPVYVRNIQVSKRPVTSGLARLTEKRVAFFGDSTVERGGNSSGNPRHYGYMNAIQGRLRQQGIELKYYNHGYSGHHWSTSRSVNNLLAEVPNVLADKPNIIVCQMTVNDFATSAHTSDLQSSIEGILTTLAAEDYVEKIWFLTNVPFTQGDAATNALASGGSNDATARQDAVNAIVASMSIPAKCEIYDQWAAMGGHSADIRINDGSRGYNAPDASEVHQTQWAQAMQADLIEALLLENLFNNS